MVSTDCFYFTCHRLSNVFRYVFTRRTPMTPSNKDKAPIDRESILKVCREWKHYWMEQEERYKITAFGIDSNMIHHVADKVWEHVQPFLTSSTEREQELVRKLEAVSGHAMSEYYLLAKKYEDFMADELAESFNYEIKKLKGEIK